MGDLIVMCGNDAPLEPRAVLQGDFDSTLSVMAHLLEE